MLINLNLRGWFGCRGSVWFARAAGPTALVARQKNEQARPGDGRYNLPAVSRACVAERSRYQSRGRRSRNPVQRMMSVAPTQALPMA